MSYWFLFFVQLIGAEPTVEMHLRVFNTRDECITFAAKEFGQRGQTIMYKCDEYIWNGV